MSDRLIYAAQKKLMASIKNVCTDKEKALELFDAIESLIDIKLSSMKYDLEDQITKSKSNPT